MNKDDYEDETLGPKPEPAEINNIPLDPTTHAGLEANLLSSMSLNTTLNPIETIT